MIWRVIEKKTGFRDNNWTETKKKLYEGRPFHTARYEEFILSTAYIQLYGGTRD